MAASEGAGAGSMQWRKLFAASTRQSLGFYPPLVSDGEMVIDPPAEFFAEGDRVWQSSVVIQFIGKPPNSLVWNFKLLWGKFGDIEIHSAGDNLFLPNLQSLEFDMEKLPVWVHLSCVPLELFTGIGLSYIASALGNPLYMDSISANRQQLAYAKVCVEVSANFQIPKFINVKLRDGTIGSIDVEVPWFPLRTKCCLFGHIDKFCDHKKTTQQVWVPKAIVNRGKLPISPDMQLGSGDIGVSTSTGSELGLDLVQALPTDPIQVVDPLEQGVVSESTQVVGPVDPIHAVDQMHPVQFVDPMHVVDPVHVVESATPVDKEQHVPDCGLVTQSPVDQVQVVISSSDQVVVSDCSNQFTTLSESDSRLVREASKGVAELMMELKQANKNVPKGKKKGRKGHHNSP
ncbi:hypothetical protein V6N13_121909 [Hibiscus sabdariffa]